MLIALVALRLAGGHPAGHRLAALSKGYRAVFTRAAREQIIVLKQKHGFTDRQMRWLRHSGQLRIRQDRAWLAPDRSMAVAGWIQLGVLALFCMAMVFAIAFSAVPPGNSY